jgi:putative endonuclease
MERRIAPAARPSSPRRRGPNLPVIPAQAGIQFLFRVNAGGCSGVADRVKQPVVYILASEPYGTLYVGVTTNLAARIEAHRNGSVDGFTERYGVHFLVYFELHDEMYEAIQREKRLKKWNRAWKIRLIQEANPEWKDLSAEAF